MKNAAISFGYNERQIKGIEEFTNNLKQEYTIVQGRGIFIPAYSEGGEFWIDVIVNSLLVKYLSDYVIGKATDSLLGKLFDEINRFIDFNKNDWPITVIKLKLKFDDTHIHIGGIDNNFNLIIARVFEQLPRMVAKFEKHFEGPISKIELPIFFTDSKRFEYQYNIDTCAVNMPIDYYFDLWRVYYASGSMCSIYSWSADSYYECHTSPSQPKAISKFKKY